ncbi:alpha-galactosidase [Priestia flexa]|uniref:alpha-galactosidase n=1 Tax=Priestia TaxID=2800373 RepID=UPI002208D71B|nr:alpha-galactosidase [Bacillus sp. 1780r2a1]
MGIIFDEKNKVFHLKAKDTSYAMGLVRDNYLAHFYWGRKINNYNHTNQIQPLDRSFSPNPYQGDRTFSLDWLPQEYPQHGNGDFRSPAYQVELPNGTVVTDLRYKEHRIYKGKPNLEELPATYIHSDDEAETLEILLEDSVIGLHVTLQYTVFENYNAITRAIKFENQGKESIKLIRALSANVDFRDAEFDMLSLPGAWGKERHVERQSLHTGIQSVGSIRGASSHQQNPFLALLRKDTTEYSGEVYGFNFVYSGNFLAQIEVDQFSTARLSVGIHPHNFTWLLEKEQTFQTPEVVMVYSSAGLSEMSHTFHHLYKNHLLRGEFKTKDRPILVNNWEATYFDFDAEKVEQIAKVGSELGMELFVLDDGWFKKRNSDTTSLGDWFVDNEKLPAGLEDVAKRVNNVNMEFGLWFEPEMVSKDSDLYREHPDWCLHVPNRHRTESREQLVLDFSREDVRTEITKRISAILSKVPITYVKWDMNRHLTEVGSALLPAERQKETSHRHILGVYKMMEDLTTAFPHILFESCSGGGGRFDPGMLYYMPQTWTSDNTDAVERLKIQYGTSLVYPIVSMGAHVSDIPNHQVHRYAPLKMRGDVAMAGNLGYELDLTKLTDEEKQAVKEQIVEYKEIRRLIQYGDFYRLLSPFEGNETAWLFTDEAKEEVVVFYYRVLAEPATPLRSIKLHGLASDKSYELIGTDNVYGGDELMYSGIHVPISLQGDFQSYVWKFKAKR